MTRKPLSPGQEKVFAYMIAFHYIEDRLPSGRELQSHFGWSSQTSAVSYMEALARKGRIEHRESLEFRKGWWRFVKEEGSDHV
jgi:hypothetical protein